MNLPAGASLLATASVTPAGVREPSSLLRATGSQFMNHSRSQIQE
jgi:hypothetical protein